MNITFTDDKVEIKSSLGTIEGTDYIHLLVAKMLMSLAVSTLAKQVTKSSRTFEFIILPEIKEEALRLAVTCDD